MELPKYDNSSKKGEDGITIVKRIIESELGWKFRKNHLEDDFGIDVYVDIITEERQITGKSIAMQIKSGESYFTEKNDFGWIYRGEMKHLNYYLNHEIPVIIVLVDDQKMIAYWSLCDPSKTVRAGESWKITMPFNQLLSKESKKELTKYISPVTDYVSQLDEFWKVNELFLDKERALFMIGKDDVLKENYEDILAAFHRMEVNVDLIKHLCGKVDLFFDGYDEDPREVYEIPEIVNWIKGFFNRNTSWAYFLTTDKGGAFLKILFYVFIDFKIRNSGKQKFGGKKTGVFVEQMYIRLNDFCDKHNIPEEINKERSFKMMDYLTDGDFSKQYENQKKP